MAEKRNQPPGRTIPPKVRALLSRQSRSTVSIPTDVLEVKGLKFHNPTFASFDSSGNVLVAGNACCALSETPGSPAQYVLGCHHVFLASENNPGMAPGPVAYVACRGVPIGPVPPNCQGTMNPGNPPVAFSNDAALALILAGGRPNLDNFWRTNWYPAGIEGDSRNVPNQSNSYAVYTDRGPLAARYVGHFGSYPIAVNGGLSIIVPEVFLYDAYCIPGDSGSPFYDVNTGIALGMHFAGAQSADTGSGYLCMAEPLWRLTSSRGPFGRNLFYARV